MQIDDVRRNVDSLWADTATSWQDEMSKKYKVVMIDEIDNLLQFMQQSCNQLMLAREDALKRLKEIQD